MTADVLVGCGAVALTVEGSTDLEVGGLEGLALVVLVGSEVPVGLDIEVEDASREVEGAVAGLPKTGLKQ